MELLNYLTDDQIALISCGIVLLFSMTLMYRSAYVDWLQGKPSGSKRGLVNHAHISRPKVVHSRANRNSAR